MEGEGTVMKTTVSLVWTLFWIVVLGGALWWLGHTLSPSLTDGHLLDWGMGALCLLWLIVLLKAPWDLYFQAQATLFEMQRSREREVSLPAGREAYVRTLARRLGWLAVSAHLVSAAGLALLTWFAGRHIGYYFAAFYLVSTVFRPALAGYAYLAHKLRAIGEEARYPREDVVELRERLAAQEVLLKQLKPQVERCEKDLQQERDARVAEEQRLRTTLEGVSREMERAVGRLTDNQEVISGVQAFVRLVTRAKQSA